MTDKKLAKASFIRTNTVPGTSGMWTKGQSSDYVDKFEFPDDYDKLVELCNHYYRTDPIVSNTINRFVDVGFKEYYLNQAECTAEEYAVYSSFNDLVLDNLRELGLEYLISGLLVPEVIWTTKKGSEISPDAQPNKTYIVPEVLWNRNPATIELKTTPIPNRLNVLVEISEEDIQFIRNGGEYADGTKDEETYRLLAEEYPEYVRAVKNGETTFKLENPHLIRRFPRKDSPYPTPYLLPALEPLKHKRNLLKMDYAIASRVITAILLIRMGNDEYPLTEDDDDQVDDIKKQMHWRNNSDNIERLFMLFGNHTLDLSWVMPDIKALLDNKKYDPVNNDILFALGFPRIMLTGETSRTGTSSAEFALLSPAETIRATRESLLSWPKRLYKDMKEKNNFENLPRPEFAELRLYDLEKIIRISDLLYERGVLSKSTLARLGGFDFEGTELPARERETEFFNNSDVPEFPLMPFTNQADSPEDNELSDDNDSEE